MPVELVTLPRVPILRTGHYDLQSGPVDFTAEHLAAAVAAFENDPAVLAPRIRAEQPDQGHLEDAAIAAEAGGREGGPALGWCDALTVDGNTLYADLHVPAELAAVMEWAYPSRSIEGLFGYTTATGNRHDFLATGLLLLGTSWPGVTTLPDLHELEREFAETVAEDDTLPVAAGFASHPEAVPDSAAVLARMGATARAPEAAREQFAAAGLAVSDLRLRWYGAEADGNLDGLPDSYDFWSWYVLEVRADDDGTLYVVTIDEATGEQWRFDVASISGADVTFATPRRGAMDWQDAAVAASGSEPRRPALALARWTSREDSRTTTATAGPTDQEDDRPMTDEERRALAAAMGLDPDAASEADVHAEAQRRAEAPAPEGTGNPPEGEPDGSPEGTRAEGAPQGEPAGVTARTATISRERLAELERDAAEGAAARARQTHADRDRLVTAAMEDGRITPAEAGLGAADATTGLYAIDAAGWRRDLEDAPEVTARALERLERGRYPGATASHGVAPQTGKDGGSLNRALRASGFQPREPKTEVTHR